MTATTEVLADEVSTTSTTGASSATATSVVILRLTRCRSASPRQRTS
jgi:hypothetical protein